MVKIGQRSLLEVSTGEHSLPKICSTMITFKQQHMSDFTKDEIQLITDALLDARITWNNIFIDTITGERDSRYEKGARIIRNQYTDLYNKVKQIKEEMV